MPLLSLPQLPTKCPSNEPRISIWHATETVDELLELLPPHATTTAEAFGIYKNTARQKEVLAEHILLHQMLGPDATLLHTPHGQPRLSDSALNISISHSHSYVAVGLATRPLGLDIETWGPRALRLQTRFLTPDEISLPHPNPERRAVSLWAAKEAVYKHFSNPALANFLSTIRISQTATRLQATAIPLNESIGLEIKEFEPFTLAYTQPL